VHLNYSVLNVRTEKKTTRQSKILFVKGKVKESTASPYMLACALLIKEKLGWKREVFCFACV